MDPEHCGLINMKISGFFQLQVIIITGANVGLGFETALDLAKRGATLILACR
jgi:NAD(P)-dependent dehydrogenase (short-subunit alcohol dehydrogenase family)